MVVLMTLETPPNGLLKTPEAADTPKEEESGGFILEYQHPSFPENTIHKVRVIYQKPLPPPPPGILLKTPEAADTQKEEESGGFVLEYQHSSFPKNTFHKVRIIYQKPRPPRPPPGKSILKKTNGKFTTSKSLATAQPSRNSNGNSNSISISNSNEHEEEAFTVQELNYRMSILFPEQHETLMQMVRTCVFGISSFHWTTTHTALRCIAFRL
jgi:hypothetical protein